MQTYGCQSMVDEIKLVLLKHPRDTHIDQATIDAQWKSLAYLGRPSFEKVVPEYDHFIDLLSQHGMEMCFLPRAADTSLDSVYAHDPVVIANRGAILCNMGKPARQGEAAAAGAFVAQLGLPILGEITDTGHLEGGDVLWVDKRTVAVGEGYRTNAEGIRQLRALLADAVDEIIPVPLPHWTGPDDCLHLLSMISPVDHDLAVVYSRLMPTPFRQWLIARGIQLIEVPDNEYESMACNVLAIAPRKCIMLAGNPITEGQLEAAGCAVQTYEGGDISIKGAGGPTCLTRPVLRAA